MHAIGRVFFDTDANTSAAGIVLARSAPRSANLQVHSRSPFHKKLCISIHSPSRAETLIQVKAWAAQLPWKNLTGFRHFVHG